MESIDKLTLDFLKRLRQNNNRDWFLANKSEYLKARNNYESFVEKILSKITEIEPIIKGLEVKSCVYRINRDIRFSNDKSPYKSHLGAYIVRGGKQNGDRYAGYYFHVEPGNNSMIAGGAYMPPSPWLNAIREEIDENGEKLQKILNSKDFLKVFGKLDGEKLKSAPKGYPKDHPHIELLKMKSFLAVRMLSDKEIVSGNCLNIMYDAVLRIKPLNDFLNNSYL
ncbi:MAG TPA: DUF2461 domain-containing protein [Bacteroidales bacterium]|nr:DUF2461 domain-containing protein [Bacteroidales bacterium]